MTSEISGVSSHFLLDLKMRIKTICFSKCFHVKFAGYKMLFYTTT